MIRKVKVQIIVIAILSMVTMTAMASKKINYSLELMLNQVTILFGLESIETDMITYNDELYVPLSNVEKITHKQAKYDKKTNTIVIAEDNDTSNPAIESLTEEEKKIVKDNNIEELIGKKVWLTGFGTDHLVEQNAENYITDITFLEVEILRPFYKVYDNGLGDTFLEYVEVKNKDKIYQLPIHILTDGYYLTIDPHKKYNLTKVQWETLDLRGVCTDMPKELVFLSIGQPTSVGKVTIKGQTYERWVYKDMYLLFQHGKVVVLG